MNSKLSLLKYIWKQCEIETYILGKKDMTLTEKSNKLNNVQPDIKKTMQLNVH